MDTNCDYSYGYPQSIFYEDLNPIVRDVPLSHHPAATTPILTTLNQMDQGNKLSNRNRQYEKTPFGMLEFELTPDQLFMDSNNYFTPETSVCPQISTYSALDSYPVQQNQPVLQSAAYEVRYPEQCHVVYQYEPIQSQLPAKSDEQGAPCLEISQNYAISTTSTTDNAKDTAKNEDELNAPHNRLSTIGYDTGYYCEKCNRRFRKPGSLKQHMNVHHCPEPRDFNCETCGKKFTSAERLSAHSKNHDKENKSFNCPYCSKTYRYRKDCERHYLLAHGRAPYPCTQCQCRFGRRDHLLNHLAVHAKRASSGGKIRRKTASVSR